MQISSSVLRFHWIKKIKQTVNLLFSINLKFSMKKIISSVFGGNKIKCDINTCEQHAIFISFILVDLTMSEGNQTYALKKFRRV